MTRYLVVGADGTIGARLAHALQGSGEVVATSRRPGQAGKVLVDLAEGRIDEAFAARSDVAFVCAAVTSIQGCEDDPDGTRQVNVTGTLRLLQGLADAGSFAVFLSSNTVFDGQQAFPDEDTPHSPTTEYGRQKAAVERQIAMAPGLKERVAIVRLSKIVSPGSGMVAQFLGRLRSGQPSPAFEDLLLCPASLAYACTGLQAIGSARTPGVFHLSGAEEMSYARLAGLLAGRVGADPRLVVPEKSSGARAGVLFSPRHPGLGMIRTRRLAGLEPESTDALIEKLVP